MDHDGGGPPMGIPGAAREWSCCVVVAGRGLENFRVSVLTPKTPEVRCQAFKDV